MNTPTVTLYSLPLYASLPLPIWVWLNLSGFIFYPSIGLWFPPASLPLCLFSFLSCRSFTSFCTGLWERPAMAVLLQGTTDMHELLHCYEFTNGSSSPNCLACVCSAFQATWQCWTHAPSMLWPGLPKEPPQANSTFFFNHLCSFCTSYWRFVKYRAEGFEWSHICLEYLFVFSAEPSDMSAMS